MHKQRIAILSTAVVGMAGTFLPWLTFGGLFEGVSVRAPTGTGWLTLGLFAAAAAAALVGDRRQSWRGGGFIAVAVPALLASAVAGVAIANQYAGGPSPPVSGGVSLLAQADPGVGLYLIAGAGVALVVAAFALQGPRSGSTP
jgi:hypothetical protein